MNCFWSYHIRIVLYNQESTGTRFKSYFVDENTYCNIDLIKFILWFNPLCSKRGKYDVVQVKSFKLYNTFQSKKLNRQNVERRSFK